MAPFRVGEVVRSREGGPEMVVVEGTTDVNPLVYCAWAEGKAITQEGFVAAALERVAPPPDPAPVEEAEA